MYIHSVKLKNYKSIGDYSENEIIIEPRITAIIGKNESGKSNILDGLSKISFYNLNEDAFDSNNANRNNLEENEYEIVLKPTVEDKKLGIKDDTFVKIKKDVFEVVGGILDYIKFDVQQDIDNIIEILGELNNNSLRVGNSEWEYYQNCYHELTKKDRIDIPFRRKALEFIQIRSANIVQEKKELLEKNIEVAIKKWNKLIELFPTFFYRKADKHLKTQYNYEEIRNELYAPSNYPNSMLSDLVNLLGITKEDFLYASASGTQAKQMTIRSKIKRKMDEKINNLFQEFYLTERVYLNIDFNSSIVSFTVRSDEGEELYLSERSNGLRWYLETFIDSQAHNVPNKNVVYLFDEPGISLHVNAQKELLRLFHDLSNNGNQVVYTTHSPYMLDTTENGIHRIRAVTKDNNGFTFIYKTAYDSRISPDNQKDTLTPLVNAIGMNLGDTVGPAKDKINIVTEGISDYIFIHTIANILKIDMEKYAIIPSVGATNCINISSILIGWGCKVIALFDYDSEGVKKGGEYMRNKMLFEYKKQYCYIKDVSQEEVNQETYRERPYMIEDLVTHEEIERFCKENDMEEIKSKALMAKFICNSVENGTFQFGDTCLENFSCLFERISNYIEK